MSSENEEQGTPDETLTQRITAPQPAQPARPAEPAQQPQWADWDQPWQAPAEPEPGQASSPGQPGRSEKTAGPVASRTSAFTNLSALRVFAQVACPVLLLIGLSFGENVGRNGWDAYPAWAVFAAVCAVLQMAPLVGGRLGLTAENSWFLAAVGTAALVGYWVIIVLPGVSSNSGFAQTLAVAFAVIGLWLSPGRRV